MHHIILKKGENLGEDLFSLPQIPQRRNKKDFWVWHHFSLIHLRTVDVSCVPGTGLGVRKQKEQGLYSHGNYYTEGVRWAKPQKINK